MAEQRIPDGIQKFVGGGPTFLVDILATQYGLRYGRFNQFRIVVQLRLGFDEVIQAAQSGAFARYRGGI